MDRKIWTTWRNHRAPQTLSKSSFNQFTFLLRIESRVTVYSDFDFRGISQKISAKDDECYNLDASLRNYVLSATLEHKIWFCTFFPTTDCQGDQIFQLGAGEFDNLFPEGMDFVSFKCRIYGDTLELVAIPVGLEMQDEAKVYLKH